MSADNTFTQARAETIGYHEQYYSKHKLFESGSWLEKPDPKTSELIKRVADKPACRVLDLGAGVGRNAIPMAKALPDDAQVTCIELVPSAAALLQEYANQHGVGKKIVVINDDFENVSLPPDEFHLVLGISTLEHCSNHDNLVKLIRRFQGWTREGGVHFLSFSTSRKVTDHASGKPIDTFVETRLQTESWQRDLADLYSGWNIEKLGSVEPYSEVLTYRGAKVIWSSDEMEILASKPNQ